MVLQFYKKNEGGGDVANPMIAGGDMIVGAGSSPVPINTLTLGATATTNAGLYDAGAFPVSKIIDMNEGTYGWLAGGIGIWVAVDLKSPLAVHGWRVFTPDGTAYAPDVVLEYSLDNTTWVVAGNIAGMVAGDNNVVYLSETITAQFWRIRKTSNGPANGGTYWIIWTFALYAPTLDGAPARLANPGPGTFTLKSVNGVVQWVAS